MSASVSRAKSKPRENTPPQAKIKNTESVL